MYYFLLHFSTRKFCTVLTKLNYYSQFSLWSLSLSTGLQELLLFFSNELASSKATKLIGLIVRWPLESESDRRFSRWVCEISDLKSEQLSCLARLWYLHNTIIFITTDKMEFKRVWYLYRLKNEKGHYIVTTYYIPHPECSSKFYRCHNPRLHLVRWVSSPPPHLHNLLYKDNI